MCKGQAVERMSGRDDECMRVRVWERVRANVCGGKRNHDVCERQRECVGERSCVREGVSEREERGGRYRVSVCETEGSRGEQSE